MDIFLVVVVGIVLSVFCGIYATKLNRSGFGYFVLSFLLSPVVGFIALLVLGKREENENKAQKDETQIFQQYKMVHADDIDSALKKVLNFYNTHNLQEDEHNTEDEKTYTNGIKYFILKKVNDGIMLELYNLPKFKEIAPEDKEQKSNINDLVKLGDLLEKGLLTKEEFDIQKAKILK